MPFIAKGATRGASNAQVLSRTHCLRFVMVPAMFARRGQVDGLNWWQSHNSKLQIAHPTTACSRRAARRALRFAPGLRSRSLTRCARSARLTRTVGQKERVGTDE